ncbi:hypothetical protein Tco_1572652, partial [Tanacetum coccineum]
NEPIYSASFIIHSKSALRNDASAAFTAEADPVNSAPSTDPHVLADQTIYVSEGMETVLTQPITGKGAISVSRQIKEETSSTIKLEDLAKLVSHVDKDEDDEVHATKNVETEDTSVLKSSSSMSSQIQDLTGNGYPRKGQNRSQNDKTEHENGKTVRSQKDKVNVKKKVKVKVNPGMRHWKEHQKPKLPKVGPSVPT